MRQCGILAYPSCPLPLRDYWDGQIRLTPSPPTLCFELVAVLFFLDFFLDEIIAHSEVVFAVVVDFSRTG